MKCCRNPPFADSVRNVMPIHVRSKVGADSGEDDLDTSALKFIDEFANRLRGGIIDVRYGACIDDEPAVGVGAQSTRART